MRIFQCDHCAKRVDASELVTFGDRQLWPFGEKVEGWDGIDVCKTCSDTVWREVQKIHEGHMKAVSLEVRTYLAAAAKEIRHGA